MNRSAKRWAIFLSAFICLFIYFGTKVQNLGGLNLLTLTSDDEGANIKIVIGTVSCRKDNDSMSNVETTVMIKSVLISARLYNVSQVEFHVFLEHMEDSDFFREALENFGFPNDDVFVSIYFHSAVDAVPKKYQQEMLYEPKFRCTYARLYFPSALPDVDSLLYLDTDFIVTGNILELWKHYKKMNDHQLIGVVANNEPEMHPVPYKTIDCFVGFPFVRPNGLNAGLLLMNLTKMREYGWEGRATETFGDYTKITKLEDQRLLNIMLHHDPGLLYLLPCQFNIRCSPCDHGFFCQDARDDPYGIQCIHGAYNQFDKNGRFQYVYELYKKFDITKDDVVKDLMLPIKNSKEPISKTGRDKCDTLINKYLYRNLKDN